MRKACQACRSLKQKCDNSRPCKNYIQRSKKCDDDERADEVCAVEAEMGDVVAPDKILELQKHFPCDLVLSASRLPPIFECLHLQQIYEQEISGRCELPPLKYRVAEATERGGD